MENKNLEETDVNEKQEVGNGKSAMPMRTCLVMILAGVYVAYLGVSLCQNVINGAEGSSPGFMVAGVIFIVLGVAFVINGIRGSLKVSKAQKEQANAENAQQAQGAANESASAAVLPQTKNSTEPGKKMSIADRANLVSKLGDAQEDEEEK